MAHEMPRGAVRLMMNSRNFVAHECEKVVQNELRCRVQETRNEYLARSKLLAEMRRTIKNCMNRRRVRHLVWAMQRSAAVVAFGCEYPCDLIEVVLHFTADNVFKPPPQLCSVPRPVAVSSNALYFRRDCPDTACFIGLKNVSSDPDSCYSFEMQTNMPSAIKSDPQKGELSGDQRVEVVIRNIGYTPEQRIPSVRVLFTKVSGFGPASFSERLRFFRRDPYIPSADYLPQPDIYYPLPNIGREVSVRVVSGELCTTSPHPRRPIWNESQPLRLEAGPPRCASNPLLRY